MQIIGFNYTKVHAERASKWEKITNISANIKFTNVEKEDMDLVKNNEVLKVSFLYEVHYEPKNAHVQMEGNILLNVEKEESKEVTKTWSKKKEVSEQLRNTLARFLWKKCSLKAFQLEEELNIPTHIQLPQISFAKKN